MVWKTILVPYDFSESAEHAAQIAVHEARVHGARIVLLHVVELMPHFGHETVMMVRPGTESQISVRGYYVESATKELRVIADRLATDGVTVDVTVDTGVPVEVIREYLQRHPIDLIVMGTHGRTGLRRVIAGSVAERLVRLSNVPVLTIRHPDAPAPA